MNGLLYYLIQDYKRLKEIRARRKSKPPHNHEEELKATAEQYPGYREAVLKGHIIYIGYSLIDQMTEPELNKAVSGMADLMGKELFTEELKNWQKYSIRAMHRHFMTVIDSIGYIKQALNIYQEAAGQCKANSNMQYCCIEIQLNGINWDSLFYLDYQWKD